MLTKWSRTVITVSGLVLLCTWTPSIHRHQEDASFLLLSGWDPPAAELPRGAGGHIGSLFSPEPTWEEKRHLITVPGAAAAPAGSLFPAVPPRALVVRIG